MKLKYYSILVTLMVMLSANLYAQDFNPAGTKIDEPKVEASQKEETKAQVASCCCTLNSEKCEDENEINKKPSVSYATKAETKPMHVRFIIAGSPSTPESSVGPGAGLHLGYFLSGNLYFGMTSVAFGDHKASRDYSDDDKEYDGEKVYGQDGAEFDKVVIDPKHVVELRVIPWNFGLYFSGGLMYNGAERYNVDFDKQDRILNGNAYKTGLAAIVKYDAAILPVVGIGYHHLFHNGFSISSGLNIAMANSQTPDVEVEAVNSDSAVLQADLDYWKKKIEQNEKRPGALMTFGVGYSF